MHLPNNSRDINDIHSYQDIFRQLSVKDITDNSCPKCPLNYRRTEKDRATSAHKTDKGRLKTF